MKWFGYCSLPITTSSTVCHLLPSLCCSTVWSIGHPRDPRERSWFTDAKQPWHITPPPLPSACPFGTGGQYWSPWKSLLGLMADTNFEAAKQTDDGLLLRKDELPPGHSSIQWWMTRRIPPSCRALWDLLHLFLLSWLSSSSSAVSNP